MFFYFALLISAKGIFIFLRIYKRFRETVGSVIILRWLRVQFQVGSIIVL